MLSDETKWQTVHNGFYASLDADAKKPIDPIIIPGFFTQHTIRTYCTSLKAKPVWWLAGQLIHLLGSESGLDFVASRHMVGLKEKSLIILPAVTSEYRLKFIPVKWLYEITLVIEIYSN